MQKAILIIGITIVIIAVVWPLKAYFQNKRAKEKKNKAENNQSDKQE